MMKYPIGIQNFEKLRSEGYVYVDKTPRQLLIFMVLIALLFPIGSWAKPNSVGDAATAKAKVMVVTTMDGKSTKLGLKNTPIITIETPYLVYKSDVAEARFELDQLRDIKYEDVTPISGDASGDGVINRADVDETVQYIFGKPSGDFVFSNADTNNDQKVNAADIVRISDLVKNPNINDISKSRNASNSDDQASYSQQHQYAIYNYRNDGAFNAWLNVNIDKITYSRVDTLGVEHKNVVLQEVWTPDSVYRIPISAIDSLGFKAPETKMRDGIFYIRDYHVRQTLSVDSLTIYFSTAIHRDSLPNVGQAVVCMTYQAPYEDGFAGRVQKINDLGDRIEVVCRNVLPFEVFEQLVLVGSAVSDPEGFRMARKASSRGYWDNWEASDHIVKIEGLPGEWKVKISDFISWKSKDPVVEVTYSALVNSDEYFMNADVFIHHHDVTFKAAFDWDKVSKMGKEYKEFMEVWEMLSNLDSQGLRDAEDKLSEKAWEEKIKIPFHAGPFNFSIELGAVLKPFDKNFKIEFTQKSKIMHHLGVNVMGQTPTSWLHDLIFPEDELDVEASRTGTCSTTKEVTSTTLDIKLSGELSLALFARFNASVLSKYLLRGSVGAEIGEKFTGTLDLRILDSDFDDMNFYSKWKNTNIDAKMYYKFKVEAGALPFNILNVTWEKEHPIWEGKFYLFPDFTKPALPVECGWDRVENESFTTTVSKNVIPLFPYYPGIAIYDDTWSRNGRFDHINEYYLDREKFDGSFDNTCDESISVTGKELIPGHTYRCYPIVKLFGHTFQANPYTEFVLPEPLKVNSSSLLMPLNTNQQIEVNGGWGYQEITCYPSDIVKVEPIATTASVDQIGPKLLRVTALKAGTTKIKIRDPRSLEEETVAVKVYDGQEEGTAVTVSVSDIDFGDLAYGETSHKSFTVTNHGSKELSYNVNNGEVNIANGFTVEGADELRFLQPGDSETFTVTAKGTGEGHYRMGVIYIFSVATKDPIAIGLKVKGKASIAKPIDLGLSVKWADRNLGALEANGEPGEYIAWGETDSKASYTWSTYSHCDGTAETCHDLGSITSTDNDAARLRWGDNWRLPTAEEYSELINKCTWTWDDTGLYQGYWVKGPNGNRIFLEAAGIRDGSELRYANSGGMYLSGTQGDADQRKANMLGFEKGTYDVDEAYRYYGASIRPVFDEIEPEVPDIPAEAVDLGLPSGTKWASYNVGATKPEDFGGYYAWGETEEKNNYSASTYKYCNGTEETCHHLGESICGTDYDVAHVLWGGDWQMPSHSQFEELINNCIQETTTLNGIKGVRFTGSNGNSIFIPAAGERYGTESDGQNDYGDYFTGTQYPSNLSVAYGFYFGYDGWGYEKKWNGHSVRPVIGGDSEQPLNEAYAVYDQQKKTLSFYYDNHKSERTGESFYLNTTEVPGWCLHEIGKYVFDPSFANARPKSMKCWFAGGNYVSFEGLEYLNTSEVESMESLFEGCYPENGELDLSFLDTSNVKDMSWMFYTCHNLKKLDVSHFNTSNVEAMEGMFYGCRSLKELDVENFNTSKVKEMGSMFRECMNLKTLYLKNFNTSNVANMDLMFESCYELNSLNISSFNTSKVKNMAFLFSHCRSLKKLNISHFDTSNVVHMGGMFIGCSGLAKLDVNTFDTSNVIDMGAMFRDCSKLKEINVSHFDTSNVSYMQDMFGGCSELNSLDLGNFDTSNADVMSHMFDGCINLRSLNISSFNTSKVSDMTWMFKDCKSLKDIDVSHFDTSSVYDQDTEQGHDYLTGLEGMFYNCASLTQIDLSGFKIDKNLKTSQMFYGCSNLRTIYCGNSWNIEKVWESTEMFANCANLVGGKGTTYDSEHTDVEYARIDGGPNSPGYFTNVNEVTPEEKEEIYVTPTEIDFGRVELDTDKTANFTVTNNKSTDVTFSVPYWGDYFEVSDTNEDITLAPGESKVFTITAHGMKRGSQASCEFRINVNTEEDMEKPTVKATLTGWDTKPLTLATNSISLSRGEEKKVEIVYGSLNYELISDDPHLFIANIADHGRSGGGWYDNYSSTTCFVRIEAGTTAEKATIRVKDKDTGEEVALQVTIDAVD